MKQNQAQPMEKKKKKRTSSVLLILLSTFLSLFGKIRSPIWLKPYLQLAQAVTDSVTWTEFTPAVDPTPQPETYETLH